MEQASTTSRRFALVYFQRAAAAQMLANVAKIPANLRAQKLRVRNPGKSGNPGNQLEIMHRFS
jgi:hypothetical protein